MTETWKQILEDRDLILNHSDIVNVTQNQYSQERWNQTAALINNLVLSKIQTIRTMHITLGGFSLALATLTVLRILYDAVTASRLQVTLKPRKLEFLSQVHPAELFPLFLSLSLVVQQSVFIGVQSSSLNNVFVGRCTTTAQVLFPAIFLVGYTNLVFGVETCVRALKENRFAPRGKLNTPICVACVGFLLLLTWIPTAIWKVKEKCFGDLVWWPLRYYLVAIAIISILIGCLFIMTVIITVQLLRSPNIDPTERIAASRMVYYMFASTVLMVLVLPFFIQVHIHLFDATFFTSSLDVELATSRLAEAALFSSGIFFAFMHLILRVNASLFVIKPFGIPWQRRRRIRIFGPSDLEMNISRPFTKNSEAEGSTGTEFEDTKSRPETFSRISRALERARASSPLLKRDSTVPPKLDPTKWPLPPTPPNEARTPTVRSSSHKRTKSTYSLFPTRAEEIPKLPPTVYSPPNVSPPKRPAIGNESLSSKASQPPENSFDDRKSQSSFTTTDAASITDIHEASQAWLIRPPPLFSNRPRHRRDSSSESSATVQIGLRFSVAPATIAAAHASTMNRAVFPTSPLASPRAVLRRDPSGSSGDSPGLPIQLPETGAPPIQNIGAGAPMARQLPSSGLVKQKGQQMPFPTKITPQNSAKYLEAARNKVLPPTPRDSVSATPAPLRMNPVTPPPRNPSRLGGVAMKGAQSPVPGPAPEWI